MGTLDQGGLSSPWQIKRDKGNTGTRGVKEETLMTQPQPKVCLEPLEAARGGRTPTSGGHGE